MYGINTGFGKLANVRIAPDQLEQLQVNLIRSHAAGVGAALRADGRARGDAAPGQRPAPSDQRGAARRWSTRSSPMLNAGVVPVVPEQGSVGASGDLAPLSHIALALMGEGDVLDADGSAPARPRRSPRRASTPYRFAPKEGLAFINGTQAQTALLALLVHDALGALAHRGWRRRR